MPDINGIPYVESTDLVSAYPAASQALAQEISDQLAEKLPYSYGTATPTTTDSGFLWYDSNSTPAVPKFWDGLAFQALTSGKILQIVRATDTTQRTTTSTSYVDANMSVTITPQKSDSAIIVLLLAYARNTSTSSQNMNIQITDASNNAISGAEEMNVTGAGGTTVTPATVIAYATPATTSAVTYKTRFLSGSGQTVEFRNDLNTGQMYAIEVAA